MGSKKCSKCGVIKSLDNFHKRNGSKGGRRSRCKDCRRSDYEGCKGPALQRAKSNYIKNREIKIAAARKYYKDNRDLCIKKTSIYKSNKRRTNPVFNFQCNVQRNLNINLRTTKKFTTKSSMYEIVGLTGKQLINHLHSTFEENYGLPRDCIDLRQVEIDHIVPLSTAKTIEEVKSLNHYSNLQLLFKEDNKEKGNKMLDRSTIK